MHVMAFITQESGFKIRIGAPEVALVVVKIKEFSLANFIDRMSHFGKQRAIIFHLNIGIYFVFHSSD